MLELIAVGSESDGDVWRRRVQGRRLVRLGREPGQGWAVPWDLRISREHADLYFDETTLRVVKLDAARNPIYYQGRPLPRFVVQPGEEFRIGRTTFKLEYVPAPGERVNETIDYDRAEQARRLRQQMEAAVAAGGSPPRAVVDNLKAVLDFLGDEAAAAENVQARQSTHMPPARETDSAQPSQVGGGTLSGESQQSAEQSVLRDSAAELLREQMEVLKERLRQEVAARQQVEDEARRAAEERQKLHQESSQLRQAEDEARRSAELEIAKLREDVEQQRQQAEALRKFEAEAELLRAELENMHVLVEQHAGERRAAEERIAALAAEQQALLEEADARRLAEAERIQDVECEAARHAADVAALRNQVDELQQRMAQEAAAQRLAEEQAASMAAEEARQRQVEEEQRLAEAQARRQAEVAAEQQRTVAENLQRELAELRQLFTQRISAQEQAEQRVQALMEDEQRRARELAARAAAEAEQRIALERELELARGQSHSLLDERAALAKQLNDHLASRNAAAERAQLLEQEFEEQTERLRGRLAALEAEADHKSSIVEAAHAELMRYLTEKDHEAEQARQQQQREEEARRQAEEAAAVRQRELETVQQTLLQMQQRFETQLAEQKKAEQAAAALAEEQARHHELERLRRQREEEARRQVEEEVLRRQLEADQLRCEVEGLKSQLQSESTAHEQVAEEARRLAAEEAARRQAEAERHEHAARAVEAAREEAERWRREAEAMREQVASIEQRITQTSSTGGSPDGPRPAKSQRPRPQTAKTSSSTEFDPYHRWLGIPQSEQPPDHYRLLGLSRFEEDLQVIEDAADRQMEHVRRQQHGVHAVLSQKLLNEIARARRCLLDLDAKASYDDRLWNELDAVEPVEVTAVQDAAQISRSLDGSAFREYNLLDYLAEMRHGHLFKVEQRSLGRIMAMFVLSDEAAAHPQLCRRFRLKAQLLARANHPHLISAMSGGEQDGMNFLVMEYVEGRHLVDVLKERGALPVAVALDYTMQAARALGYLHDHDVIHRNVKPSNMLLDRKGQVWLTGLSQALFRPACPFINAELLAGLDERGPVGTPDYMAPEQAVDSGDLDCTADIYSIGCTLFTLLTRRLIFTASDVNSKIAAHREQQPPSLRHLRDDIPEVINQIFQKAVAKNPAKRFGAMEELLTSLEVARTLVS